VAIAPTCSRPRVCNDSIVGRKGLSLISISLSYTHTHTHTHTHHLTHALNVARGAADAWPKQKHVVLQPYANISAHTPREQRALCSSPREVLGRWWVLEVSVFTRVKSTSFVLFSLNHQSQVKSVSFITVRLKGVTRPTSSSRPSSTSERTDTTRGKKRTG
jgi:hypothetical protein